VDALSQVAGFLIVSTACGMMFAFGVVSVCRWMKWSPITTNVVNYFPNVDNVTTITNPARPERAGNE